MTDSIKHHLSDAMLFGYSAGTLPEAFNLVVATHISMCDECRARLASFDAVGGSILDNGETTAVAEDSFAATMALIERAPQEKPELKVANGATFPAPLQEYVGGDVDTVKWRKIGGGVRQAILPTSKDASARLLYIPAGAKMPDHGHHGTEMTLVLQGAFCDENDRFGRGDVEMADEDMEHTPVAEDWGPCICLAATDAPLKFSGIIPRVAQPFFKI